jgi:hypothetical protein
MNILLPSWEAPTDSSKPPTTACEILVAADILVQKKCPTERWLCAYLCWVTYPTQPLWPSFPDYLWVPRVPCGE